MSVGGAKPAGSSRAWRLDPLSLPVRYAANDAAADGRERLVELHRERVVVQSAVGGVRSEVSTPVSEFLGVAIRILPPAGDFDGAVAVVLEHRDCAQSIPLFVAADGREMTAEWQTWARVLDLPRLVVDADGAMRDPFASTGSVHVGRCLPRRGGRRTLRARRGVARFRRKGGLARGREIHRDEREIIARN